MPLPAAASRLRRQPAAPRARCVAEHQLHATSIFEFAAAVRHLRLRLPARHSRPLRLLSRRPNPHRRPNRARARRSRCTPGSALRRHQLLVELRRTLTHAAIIGAFSPREVLARSARTHPFRKAPSRRRLRARAHAFDRRRGPRPAENVAGRPPALRRPRRPRRRRPLRRLHRLHVGRRAHRRARLRRQSRPPPTPRRRHQSHRGRRRRRRASSSAAPLRAVDLAPRLSGALSIPPRRRRASSLGGEAPASYDHLSARGHLRSSACRRRLRRWLLSDDALADGRAPSLSRAAQVARSSASISLDRPSAPALQPTRWR